MTLANQPPSARDGISIIGAGHQLGSVIEDNPSLCRRLQVTPEWIAEKTGILQRHLAAPDESASGLAGQAARQALAAAGISADQLDIIIVCTFSGDYLFPPLSAKLHQDLGAKGAQIYDLQANCAGVVAGLTAASDRLARDATLHYALVVGVELNSRYVDRSDVSTAVYLSDGAGALVLGRCATGQGVQASAFFTDSAHYESVRLRGGGSSHPLQGRGFDAAVDQMEMNGIATWKQAITHLPKVMRRVCEKQGVALQDVDFFLFHQANLRMIDYVMAKMGVPADRTYTNVAQVGNTGSASIAIVLSEAQQQGRLRPGMLVMLAAVGAGFNFGASLWRWTAQGLEPSA